MIAAFALSHWPIWSIAAAATAGVVFRPFGWPEYVWAVAGSVLLVMVGLLSFGDAVLGIQKGADVYCFLAGMMLLAELARQEGLFEWVAAQAVRLARGSGVRLFTFVFAVGTVVTVFLSNDATAVVLTPAVAAVVRAAKIKAPLPYLFICAFIANAASFVLPISNPANLVMYGSHLPSLPQWVRGYALPSAFSIAATYGVLRWTQRRRLPEKIATGIGIPELSSGGRLAALGIAGTIGVLLGASAFGRPLGTPTFLAALATAILVPGRSRAKAARIIKEISWGILPLVAGLFVLVEALEKTGITDDLASGLHDLAQRSVTLASVAAGVLLALGCNLVNNLPASLMAGRVVGIAEVSEQVRRALLIGVNLGPNLSVTGSLATILWLHALRREGERVSARQFLKLGALMMPLALLPALFAVFAFG